MGSGTNRKWRKGYGSRRTRKAGSKSKQAPKGRRLEVLGRRAEARKRANPHNS